MAIEEDEEIGVPEWVVTFGDMMSLLLTFFIMLVSMSEIKEQEQFQAMVESIKKQFGYDQTINAMMPGKSKPRNSVFAKMATVGRSQLLDMHKGGNRVQSPIGDHAPARVMVSAGGQEAIGAAIFFDEDSAELSEEALLQLDEIARMVKGKPQKIVVSGHTSRKPVAESGYADNWDLAFQRSQKTMQYLITKGEIDRRRFRLSVAGPNEPIPGDIDVGNFQRDSRVMVYLIDDVVSQTPGIPEK